MLSPLTWHRQLYFMTTLIKLAVYFTTQSATCNQLVNIINVWWGIDVLCDWIKSITPSIVRTPEVVKYWEHRLLSSTGTLLPAAGIFGASLSEPHTSWKTVRMSIIYTVIMNEKMQWKSYVQASRKQMVNANVAAKHVYECHINELGNKNVAAKCVYERHVNG